MVATTSITQKNQDGRTKLPV